MADEPDNTTDTTMTPETPVPDEQTQTTETSTEAAAPVQPAPKPEPKGVPQDEVNRIVEKRVAKERRKHEREIAELKARQTPEPTTTTSDKTDTELAATVAAMKERLDKAELDREFAEQVGALNIELNATRRKMLRAEFDPDDPDAVKTAASDAGWINETPAVPVATAQPETSEGVMSQYQSPGAPSAPPRGDITLDPKSWTKDDVDRMKRDNTFLSNVEKWADTLPGGGGGLFRKKIPKG